MAMTNLEMLKNALREAGVKPKRDTFENYTAYEFYEEFIAGTPISEKINELLGDPCTKCVFKSKEGSCVVDFPDISVCPAKIDWLAKSAEYEFEFNIVPDKAS